MLDPTRPFLISPPFGTYIRHKRAYSILGSFTQFPRPGRTMQVLRTVRPLGREPDGEPKGWVNKVGLRNPSAAFGIPLLQPVSGEPYRYSRDPHIIYSIAMLDGNDDEWEWLDRFLRRPVGAWPMIVEINVSCPNTDHPIPALPTEAYTRSIMTQPSLDVIWKLPPVDGSVAAALCLADRGARYIHLSNTLSSPIGGLSGKAQREVNLPLVGKVANALKKAGHGDYTRTQDVTVIIAGGGIYTPDHVRQYSDAGAIRYSLSTAWFWPPRAYKIMRAWK